jgi:hypothetical protein
VAPEREPPAPPAPKPAPAPPSTFAMPAAEAEFEIEMEAPPALERKPPAPPVAAPPAAVAAPPAAKLAPPPEPRVAAPAAPAAAPPPVAKAAPPAAPAAAPAAPSPAPPSPTSPGVDLLKEIAKGGAKPLVDAGQALDASKKFSRWKPVREAKAAEAVDESLAAIAEPERAKHVEAKKLARLLVSEIRMYNEAKVAVGKKNKDLYERLKDDIERSKQSYVDRVGKDIAAKTTYFHDELVATLADGDAAALGRSS